MNLSPLVSVVVEYMVDHFPTTPEELNFHAELKASSHWCWSDDYSQLVRKEVSVDNCQLKIAVTEILKTWKKEETELLGSKAGNKRDKSSDSSDESLDEQLSGVSGSPTITKYLLLTMHFLKLG